jgi:hypothetical protein
MAVPRFSRWQAALITVVVVALISVPTALGAKPTRTVIHPEGDVDFVFPAGFGCSFDVRAEPDENGSGLITEFSDGRVVTHGHADITLTNLETGDSFLQRSRYEETVRHVAETNDLFVEISGRYGINLFPGDQGPFGEVGENGALLSVVGHQVFTLDLDTDVITAYSLTGKATDACAELSG